MMSGDRRTPSERGFPELLEDHLEEHGGRRRTVRRGGGAEARARPSQILRRLLEERLRPLAKRHRIRVRVTGAGPSRSGAGFGQLELRAIPLGSARELPRETECRGQDELRRQTDTALASWGPRSRPR